MFEQAREVFAKTLEEIRGGGLLKEERVLGSAQGGRILVDGRDVLNFCANNYLGLANHPAIVAAAERGLRERGFGLASVRFICGTQDLHKALEGKIAGFLGMESAILYSSCFDANGGLFETLLGEGDAVISDGLNHASIIDGVRLCKAKRLVYLHDDMGSLEEKLVEAGGARLRMVATDGVFSMDGDVARLGEICDLAEKHRAMVMVDDSHGTGVLGEKGRGSHEYRGVMGRVDLVTSTLGKALGGATGGFTAGRREVVELLRNRSRPYLFSNSLAPAVAAASIEAIELIGREPGLREKLGRNGRRFREGMKGAGFDVAVDRESAIVPIMLGEAGVAVEFARRLLVEGIYVIGFSYPVVAMGKARIRVQLSAAHEERDVDLAIAAFVKVRDGMKVQARLM